MNINAQSIKLVQDLMPGTASSFAMPLASYGNKLMVNAEAPNIGYELFSCENDSLSLVADLFPGGGNSSFTHYMDITTMVNFSLQDIAIPLIIPV